ncbi:RNA polymerase sigma factor [Sphingomonas naphthae]|uniref:RNA polymerase sigma factor n=1 Tax=Sphingomonas naphthae TaxID=1813468 RepID=A0ABY7TGD0_9SPHN|nr:RNA polymerase sigma factor [Sphingomonas naphthae]WCT72215.1 RNA polymerase sigma factor [Sphingomonas naphthae]
MADAENGDGASGLEAVLLAHRPMILRFLRARGAGGDAEDVLQDIWLKLGTARPAGPIADPLGYLLRMADNLMHDRHRASARRSKREASWIDAVGGGDAAPADHALAARETLSRADRALSDLGERTRSIFHRFRIDGVEQRQIAADDGISLSAVEKHLQKAYRALMRIREEA